VKPQPEPGRDWRQFDVEGVSMKRIAFFLLLVAAVYSAGASGVREQVSVAICAIRTPIPETRIENGQLYQLYKKPAGPNPYARLILNGQEMVTNNGIGFETYVKLPGVPEFEPQVTFKTGTGFFVTSGKFFYLVTAQHVAVDCNDETSVIVSDDQKAFPVNIKELLGSSNSGSFWIHDLSNDVSVLPVFGSVTFIKKFVEHRVIGPEMIPQPLQAPSRDNPVNLIGFPGFEGATGLFSPLSRETRVASGLLGPSNGASSYFYLQDPAVQGYSGAPVLDFDDYPMKDGGLRLGGGLNVKCLGVVSQTASDNTGGKMARIVPSVYFMELMRQFESSARYQSLFEDFIKRYQAEAH